MSASSRLLLALLLVLATAAACGDDDGDGGGTELSRYSSVADLAEDLTAAGLSCTLEYEGLQDDQREVSLCTVEDELAELSVWSEPADATATAAQADEDANPLAAGANWTVDVETADTAEAVAEALDGAVRGT